MNKNSYKRINRAAGSNEKLLAVLLDPDNYTQTSIRNWCKYTQKQIDFFFVGGSLTTESIFKLVKSLKELTQIPIVLFPGNLLQIDENADALLLLSLVSGRNPELLIGNHVIAAPFIKKSGLECISTAYMLVESGITTSVEYISNTKPIPRTKTNIAVATAMAAELLGFKQIYLEAGSGALNHVPCEMIEAVRKETKLPIIVGGGIKSSADLKKIYQAGADMAVVGNSLEKNPELIDELIDAKIKFGS